MPSSFCLFYWLTVTHELQLYINISYIVYPNTSKLSSLNWNYLCSKYWTWKKRWVLSKPENSETRRVHIKMLRCQRNSDWVVLCFHLKIDKWSLKIIVEHKIFLWFRIGWDGEARWKLSTIWVKVNIWPKFFHLG